MEKKDVILRNSRAEQYLCAAKKNFIEENGILSESHSKTVICHFSDLHGDWKRFEHILTMIEYFKPVFAIHTGDLVCWDSNDEWEEFFNRINECDIPVYNCLGNHETFRGQEVLKNEYLHDRYIKPLKNINTTGKGYYYTDFTEQKIRLIVLNDYENDAVETYNDRKYELMQEQCSWLAKVLKDCEEKELGVIIAAHEADEAVIPGSNGKGFCQRAEPHPWGVPMPNNSCNIAADLVDAFQNGKVLKREYVWKKSGNKVKIECEFTKKSEFICWMNGHRHGDYIGYLPSYPNQLSLGMTCSGCFPEGYHNIGDEISDLPRIPDTISEDAINFYVLDRKSKTVSVVRMGAYVNDLFEERLAAKFSYGVKN